VLNFSLPTIFSQLTLIEQVVSRKDAKARRCLMVAGGFTQRRRGAKGVW